MQHGAAQLVTAEQAPARQHCWRFVVPGLKTAVEQCAAFRSSLFAPTSNDDERLIHTLRPTHGTLILRAIQPTSHMQTAITVPHASGRCLWLHAAGFHRHRRVAGAPGKVADMPCQIQPESIWPRLFTRKQPSLRTRCLFACQAHQARDGDQGPQGRARRRYVAAAVRRAVEQGCSGRRHARPVHHAHSGQCDGPPARKEAALSPLRGHARHGRNIRSGCGRGPLSFALSLHALPRLS